MFIKNFEILDNMFVESKFPAKECNIKSKKEKGIYDSKSKYLCLIIDKRFPQERSIKLLSPYIWVGNETDEPEFANDFGWAWIDESGNYFDNFENPVHGYTWDEFVIGWMPYNKDKDDNYLSNLISNLKD